MKVWIKRQIESSTGKIFLIIVLSHKLSFFVLCSFVAGVKNLRANNVGVKFQEIKITQR